MKIFAFSGSPRGEKSIGYKLLKKVEMCLNEIDIDVSMNIYRADMLDIKESNGAAEEFSNGKTLYNDDMSMLEKEMLESDMIIFVSPVYAHNVSAQMKKFIDRIAYWLHLYRLAGRTGYIISVSSNNGNEKVNDYLQQMMEYLGLYVLGDTSIQSVQIGEDDSILDSYARFICNKIALFQKQRTVKISYKQEQVFQIQKEKYLQQTNDDFEKNYWEKQEYFHFQTFEELFMNRMKR